MAVFHRRWPGVSYGRGEGWHYVGEAGEPAFQGSWGNLGATRKLAFRIREAGIVDIQGRVQTSSPGSETATIFQLPDGYKPSVAAFYNSAGHTDDSSDPLTPVVLDVTTGGAVSIGFPTDINAPRGLVGSMSTLYIVGQFFLNPASAP